MNVKSRYYLSSKKIKKLMQNILEKYSFLIGEINLKNSKVELIETDEKNNIYIVDGIVSWIKIGELFFPSLIILNKGLTFPRVTVDMGAVPYVSKGADVMIPGIVDFPIEIKKGDIVGVVDEKNNKCLAVGEVLINSGEFKISNKGKAIKNIHHVGDKIWGLITTLGLKD
ncbi:MAG: DUF1947 domain-containing protein [Candidatus Odinarchaeia archaeon]